LCVLTQSIAAGHEWRIILLHKLRVINQEKYSKCSLYVCVFVVFIFQTMIYQLLRVCTFDTLGQSRTTIRYV